MKVLSNWRMALVAVVIVLSVGLIASAGDFRQKLDPMLRRLVEQNEQKLEETGKPLNLGPYADRLEVFTDGEPVEVERNRVTTKDGRTKYNYEVPEGAYGNRLGVLIKTDSPTMLKAKGVFVRSVAGDIVTATATLQQVKKLGLLPSVRYVQASRRVELHLNKSVPAVGAAKLSKDNPKLRGDGVIVGDVDTGIDYDHKDFRVEEKSGDGIDEETARILYLWDQQGNQGKGGPGPSPSTFSYGTEYTKSEIEYDIANGLGPTQGEVLQADVQGHGTHVSGIMASDGSSNPDTSKYPTYAGMAPEADIIMVKTGWTDANIIDGVNYIFQKADNQGKPAVVNLSLGSHYGPHDGTSLFSQAMDELSGSGQVIVASAGNEGSDYIHGNLSLESGDSKTLPLAVNPGGGKVSSSVAVNSWYPGDSGFAVTVSTPSGTVLTVPSGSQTQSVTVDGTVYIDNASTGPNRENGDKQLEIDLLGSDYVPGSPDVTPGVWLFKMTAPPGTEGGRLDSWVWTGSAHIPPDVGNNRMSVGIPGVAKDVITVGAWTTKTRWIGADGNEHGYSNIGPADVGNIATFSSWGPTRDDRLKPEITAPGFGIASSLSGYYALDLKNQGLYDILATEDKKHVIMQGTSMSAPHISGQVALLLQQDSNLSPTEVEKRLINTASSDQYTSVGYDPASGNFDRDTGLVSNYTWGHGKLDSAQVSRTLGFSSSELDAFKVKFGPNPAPASEEVYLYYQLPGSSAGTLKVFNATGRQVYSASLSADESVHEWSLVNESGKALANGVYMYVVRSGSQTSDIGKLMVERK